MPAEDERLRLSETDLVLGEVVDDPVEAVRATIPQRHDNLLFLPPVTLHDGPRSRIIARICLIYEHATAAFHHARVDVHYFSRQRQAEPFVLTKQAALDGQALVQLLASLLDITPLQSMSIDQAEHVLLLPLDTAPLQDVPLQRLAEGVSRLLRSEQGWRALCDELLTDEALDNWEQRHNTPASSGPRLSYGR